MSCVLVPRVEGWPSGLRATRQKEGGWGVWEMMKAYGTLWSPGAPLSQLDACHGDSGPSSPGDSLGHGRNGQEGYPCQRVWGQPDPDLLEGDVKTGRTSADAWIKYYYPSKTVILAINGE